jgi:hypothetical protein
MIAERLKLAVDVDAAMTIITVMLKRFINWKRI